MTATFIGEDTFKVDGKGRVSIPADFRKVIDAGDSQREPGTPASFILVYGNSTRNFLEGFPVDVHADLLKRIATMQRGSPRRRALERFYSGQAMRLTLDDTGRIVLPKKARDKIEVTDVAFFIADNDTFQIWKPETYEEDIGGGIDDEFDPDVDPSIYIPAEAV
jgi:MraZ protein